MKPSRRSLPLLVTTVAALLCGHAAAARPPTVADLLNLSEPGPFALTPDGRFALAAYLAPYRVARDFADESQIEAQRARLRLVSLHDGRSRTLRVQPGPFAPDGRRLIVFAHRGGRLRPGILNIDTGRVVLLNAQSPPFGLARRTGWSAGDLLALVADQPLVSDAGLSARVQTLWARQRRGREPSATEISTLHTPVRQRRLVAFAGGGAPHTLARGPFEDFEPAPGGRWVALIAPGPPKALALTPTLQVADRFHVTRLHLLDRTSGTIRPVCEGLDILPTLLSWSPDGGRLAVIAREAGATDWRRVQVRIVEPSTFSCAALPSPPGSIVRRIASDAIPVAALSWMGSTPLLASWTDEAGPPSWSRLEASGPTPSGPPQQSAPPAFAESFRPDAASAALADPDEVSPRAATNALRLVRQPDGSATLLDRASKGDRTVASFNRELTQTLSASVPIRVEARADGPPHWLYPPLNLKPGRSAPLVVLPYPGSVSTSPPRRYAAGSASLITQAQLLTAHGYAVLVPSLPPPRDPHWPDRPWPTLIVSQLRAAIIAARRYPFVDPARVAVWGHSFGGLAALLAAEHIGELSAVVAQNAPTDLTSLRGSLPLRAMAFSDPDPSLQLLAGWAEGGQGALETTPWSQPERYQAASPLFGVADVACPVLLMTGDRDFVSSAQSQEMFAALRRLDKPAELQTFWGEGHVLLSPANIQRSYDAAFAFLDRAFSAPPPPSSNAEPRLPAPPGP